MRFIRTSILLACALALFTGDALARGGGGFKGGGGGFSAGKSFSSPAPKNFSTPQSAPKAFVAPTPVKPAAPPPPKAGAKPPNYDAAAQRARTEAESANRFQAAKSPPAQPAPAAKPSQQTRVDAPKAGEPSRENSWAPRYRGTQEERRVVERYTVYQQNDGVSPWFWMYLMQSNNQNQRQNDEWIYHNRERLSPERLEDLRRQDADLDKRLKTLEEQGVKKDPNFKHPVVDETKVVPPTPVAPSRFWSWVWTILGLALFLGAIYYIFFVHRWKRGYA